MLAKENENIYLKKKRRGEEEEKKLVMYMYI